MARKIILLFALVTGIIAFPLAASAQSDAVPAWVKNTAGWWADDQISETEFVNSMEYLIDSGIIDVSSQNFGITELTIGFIPSEKADELSPKAESLARFLESEFNGKVDVKIVVPTNYEVNEISMVKWASYAEAVKLFRFYNLEKIDLLKRLDTLLKNNNIYQ